MRFLGEVPACILERDPLMRCAVDGQLHVYIDTYYG